MSISWAILVPIAVLTMRFGKRWNPMAFNVHRITNTTAVLMTITGALLAFFSSGRAGGLVHRVIGYVIVGVSIVQVLGGLLRPHKDAGEKRQLWYAAHVLLGVAGLVLAAVNIFRGIGLNIVGYQTVWRIVAAVCVGVAGALALGMTALPRTFPTVETVKAPTEPHPTA